MLYHRHRWTRTESEGYTPSFGRTGRNKVSLEGIVFWTSVASDECVSFAEAIEPSGDRGS